MRETGELFRDKGLKITNFVGTVSSFFLVS